MNKNDLATMAAAVLMATAGANTPASLNAETPLIGKQEITIKDGKLTPEAFSP